MLLLQLGRVEYAPTYAAMQAFTAQRDLPEQEPTEDQLWICEHPPVYTQGLAGKPEHIFNPSGIPVVQTNRGGQVTYHGPGQVVGYPLINLKRAGYFVKEYVYRIEEALIRTLLHFGVTGHRVAGAPGIYIRLDDPAGHAPLANRPSKDASNVHTAEPDFRGLGKIAALGIKVSRNCTYHGLALNVAMDLEPFACINPCGYVALQTVDLSTIGVSVSWDDAADVLSRKLATYLAP
ncbi:lipoyl(octanoyl) transferase [Rhodoferax lacus]|uniref:Octanoyltransferase n=1 Tax=Rhodoferax lacus TaxID=2184758 RepID=A0A3E1R7U4_9BURK|nr:lipoyl(octanoyl) transferase LipB [Rhodoferax lacus]RFO94780.1 lipoyl(octanoyl) transferase [Rhodoferax lacus]